MIYNISEDNFSTSPPRLFLVTTPGASATRWLSFALASCKDVYVSHGKHPLNSIINGNFMDELLRGDDKSFTEGRMLADFYQNSSLEEMFCSFQSVMPGAKAYGNVHGLTIIELVKKVQRVEELNSITIVNLLRHPVNYVLSHYRLVQKAERNPHLYAHYKNNMFAEVCTKFPEVKLLDCIEEKKLLAFSVSCLSVYNLHYDFQYPQFEHVPMESITSDVQKLYDLCYRLTGIEYSRERLEEMIQNGPINRHQNNTSGQDPLELYESLETWQQDLMHIIIPDEVLDVFESSGYDISMLQLPTSSA